MSEKKFNPYFDVIHKLALAFNAYVEMEKPLRDDSTISLPLLQDDLNDFRRSIHEAQRIVIRKALVHGTDEQIREVSTNLTK